MTMNELDQWLNLMENEPEDIPEDIKSEIINHVMAHICTDVPDNNEELDQWLDHMEGDAPQLPQGTEAEAIKRILPQIHGYHDRSDIFVPEIEDIDVDSVLETFDPGFYDQPKNTRSDQRKARRILKRTRAKVASIILICIAGLSISGAAYAAFSGRISGAHKATPELIEQLDHPNPVLEVLDSPPSDPNPVDNDKYTNTRLLDDSSFEDPSFYNTVTDVHLQNIDHAYSTEEFIFDLSDIVVFTKEQGEAWHLNEGETLQIKIAIDADFAAAEIGGEDIQLAYVKDRKYIPLGVKTIRNTPSTFSFTAPEDGDYYLAVTNASLTYLKVTTLEIQK